MKKFDFGKFLSSYGMIALIVILGVFIISFLVKSISSFGKGIQKIIDKILGEDEETRKNKEDNEKDQSSYVDEVRKEQEKSFLRPTLQPSDFKRMANNIYTYLNHSFYEDDTSIYHELGWLKNKADWNELVLEYGTRKLSAKYFVEEQNLPSHLNDYLDNYHKWLINKYFRSKGIPEL